MVGGPRLGRQVTNNALSALFFSFKNLGLTTHRRPPQAAELSGNRISPHVHWDFFSRTETF